MPKSSMERHSTGRARMGDTPASAAGKKSLLEFLDGAFRGLMERRRETWNRYMAQAFDEIRKKGEGDAAQTLRSDHFLTFVTEATLIACRNHDGGKLKALKNAVVHAALRDGPDESLQLMFLRLIDHLTPLHLVTLAVLDDPVQWMAQHGLQNPRWPVGTSSTVIQYCVPQLRENPAIAEMIVRDLQGAGLVEQGYFLRMPMSDDGMLQSRTTDSGRMLARYISDL